LIPRTNTLPDSVKRCIKEEVEKALDINQPEITGILRSQEKMDENQDKISIIRITRKDGRFSKDDIKSIYGYSEGRYRRITHELVVSQKPLIDFHKKGGLKWAVQEKLRNVWWNSVSEYRTRR